MSVSVSAGMPPAQRWYVPYWRVLLQESWIWAPLAIAASLFANYVATGGRAGLLPRIGHPVPGLYAGDGMGLLWTTQKLVDGGWIFHTDRSGYPFGSDYLDYPMSDSGSFAIIKLLALMTGTSWGALDLFFVLGFAVGFIACYAGMRAFGISRAFAAAGALLFVLLPFHFQRVQHLLLTWYFGAPLFFLMGWRLFRGDADESNVFARRSSWLLVTLGLLALSCFNVYYTAFGTLVILVGGVAGFARTARPRRLVLAIAALAVLGLGTVVNVLPSVLYTVRNGTNFEVAQRWPEEAEVYGLKLVQMLLPRGDHRIYAMRTLARRYAATAPLINENHMAALGLVGSIGLVLLGAVVFVRIAGVDVDARLTFLALATLVLFVTATIGGLSSFFSLAITPLLRGWNRVSVFIAFAAFAALMIVLDRVTRRFSPRSRLTAVIVAVVIAVAGAFDETVPACGTCVEDTNRRFNADAAFVKAIERALPAGSAVYQLPYMPFPEVGPVNALQAYDLGIGALHSKALRWNYAGMKGRDGDLFYRALAREPIAAQLEVLRALRFAGIYVDRRGYEDNGKAVEHELQQALGSGPAVVHPDGIIAFYRLDPAPNALPGRTDQATIARQLGPLDPVRPRFGDVIDFRNPILPPFLRHVRGLSPSDPWGRWSDANLERDVVLSFIRPLPASFTLVFRARAFGPNTKAPVLISAGGPAVPVMLTEEFTEQRIRLSSGATSNHDIRIVPPAPISPWDWRGSDDPRKVGVGLEQARLEP